MQVELGDVVEEDEEGEQDDADEGYLVDDFLELLIDVAAHDAFNDEEEDHAAVEQGEGHQVEDAEVERDHADEVQQRPDAHLGGDVDLLRDADGAHHLVDGYVAGEEAFKDAEDEQGSFAGVLDGLLHGLADGEAFDVSRWRLVGEAQAILVGGARGFHLLGRGGEGERLAVAEDAEGVGRALVVLKKSQQGKDRVGLEAVDADDLVAGLHSGAVGGRARGHGEDVDGAWIHARDEANGHEVIGAEFSVGGDGDGEGAGAGFAVVLEGDGERPVEIEGGLLEYLFPSGVRDVVEAGDGVAGGEAVGGGWGALGDVVDDGRAVEVLVDFVVIVGDEKEQQEREDEVEDGSGDGDEDALPAGFGGEVVVGGGALIDELADSGGRSAGNGSAVAAEFAGHFDVAAEGEEGDAVVGIAVAEAEEAGSEADGEGFDADAAGFGNDKVAELMDEDKETEDDGEFNDDEENVHADYAGTLEVHRQNRAKQ